MPILEINVLYDKWGIKDLWIFVDNVGHIEFFIDIILY